MIEIKTNTNGKEFDFRLLNSEIGNDQIPRVKMARINKNFRLLNSEIGNDQGKKSKHILTQMNFRLLNSEIGNDHNFQKYAPKKLSIFVSLTRR